VYSNGFFHGARPVVWAISAFRSDVGVGVFGVTAVD
jgi:hypothetical protein